jgi:hypothetical protein
MAQQSRPDPSTMEPAEGSRETVNANSDDNQRERERFEGANTDPKNRDDAGGDQGGGITNRPLREEIDEQSELPQRGEAKEDR